MRVEVEHVERVGTSCEPMSAARVAAVVAERRGDDWSAGDSGVAEHHAALQAVEEARRLLSRAPHVERRRWADLSQPDLIRRLGLGTSQGTLTRAVRALTLAESAGLGADRMYAEMVRVGHRPPVWDADPFRVTVTLNGGAPNSSVARSAATLPGGRDGDPDTLLVMLTLLTERTRESATTRSGTCRRRVGDDTDRKVAETVAYGPGPEIPRRGRRGPR